MKRRTEFDGLFSKENISFLMVQYTFSSSDEITVAASDFSLFKSSSQLAAVLR